MLQRGKAKEKEEVKRRKTQMYEIKTTVPPATQPLRFITAVPKKKKNCVRQTLRTRSINTVKGEEGNDVDIGAARRDQK